MELNPQAQELNKIIGEPITNLLSKKGKAIFFPKKGILAQTADAKGKKIDATIGIALEDDHSPMRLKVISDNFDVPPQNAFPYAPSFGRKDLREKWKHKIYEKNPALESKDFGLPIVTNALTHALSVVGYLFIDEGDKIITPDMYWGNYNLIFANGYNAEFDKFPLFRKDSFNLEGFKEKFKEIGKKIVVLNFPNNPTGYTPTVDEVKEIVNTLKEAAENGSHILVVCDDAYFGLFYEDNIEKESIFSYLCDLHENILAIKIDGPTKEDYVWGFRVGFITFGIKNGSNELYDALENKTSGTVRGNISNVSNLSQSLLLKAYDSKNYNDEKQQKFQLLKSRYEKVKEILKNEKFKQAFTELPFNSGYFMCIRLNKDAEEVRQKLLKEYDTGVIAIGNLLRIAFSAVPADKLQELFENIYHAAR